MFANARAIAVAARLAGRLDLAAEFDKRAAEIKNLLQKPCGTPPAIF